MKSHSMFLPALAAATFVTASSATVDAQDSTPSGKRPNFLFIIVDDQSPFDLKVYNPDSALETPNIDKLAREGMVFDSAHHMGGWVGGVCTPSRHMVMSGRTVWHITAWRSAVTGCKAIRTSTNTLGAYR